MSTLPNKLRTNFSFRDLKWCVFATVAIAIFSLVPQLHFWAVRGSEWKGAFTVTHGDELLYSAYVNALIDGRPRRTDPASGRDDHQAAPLHESLFSIQFIPAYVIAIFAKALGLSASSAFIGFLAIEGALASLSLYWLFSSITGDRRFSGLGVLVVLCFGALAAGQGLVGLMLKPDVRFLGLPFLRRYEPGVPFPLFFVFSALLWKAFTVSSRRAVATYALLAGLTCAALVFSYFYLWTTAVAWLVCVTGIWLTTRWGDYSKVARIFIVVSLPLSAALAPYIYLLSRLPADVKKAQVLTFTHGPDLFRIPEIIGAVILVILVIAVRQNRVSARDPRFIFAASFALLPFLVFNQQVITGRSIQPFHYEVLIVNYVVLVSLVLVAKIHNVAVTPRGAVLLVVLCLSWAGVEQGVPSPIRSANDVKLDQMVPVLMRLNDLATTDGTWNGLRNNGHSPGLVFSPDFGISRLLPTWAPQGLLLGTGSASFQGLSQAERKQWIYLHLYYSGNDENYLRDVLNDRIEDTSLTYFIKSTTFGPERILLFLGWNAAPVSQDEIEKEVTEYAIFMRSFSQQDVLKRPISYVITHTAEKSDFARIDTWYERDNGERVGDYFLYRVKVKETPIANELF